MKALEMLQDGHLSASEIAYKTGFNSPAYFNKCFSEFFGYPPGKVIKGEINYPVLDNLSMQIPAIDDDRHKRGKNVHIISVIMALGILLVVSVFLRYNWMKKSDSIHNLISSDGSISIVVMPFQNMTNDTTWEVWQNGIQQDLSTSLSNIRELKIRQKIIMNSVLKDEGVAENASISPEMANAISQKLGADTYIYGSIQQTGDKSRLTAQLIATKTNEIITSLETNGQVTEGNIFDTIDSLRNKISDFLVISKLVKENQGPNKTPLPAGTRSAQALRYSIYGSRAFFKAGWATARNWFLKALAVDSNYTDPMSGIYFTFKNQGMIQESLYWLLKLYHKKEQMSVPEQLFTDWEYAQNFETPEVQLKYLRELHDIDDQNDYHYLMGSVYVGMKQYANAIGEFETFMDEGRRKGRDHLKDNWVYPALGEVYHITGQYRKEKRIYREAERNFSDHNSIAFSWVIRDQASLALSMGDTAKAKVYMKKFISVMKENSATEADITDGLAWVYWNADKKDRAEELFRRALFLEPLNPKRMNTLACRLIDRKKNSDEVSELTGKALGLAVNKWDFYNYFDTKGWGLYRQGKYKESLELFQNIWDSIPYKMYFIYAHLEEIKKASAGQK